MSLSRNRAEEGTGNILGTIQFTSKHTDICHENCHVSLKIYLLCPCLYHIFVFREVRGHRSIEALDYFETTSYLDQ